MFPVVCYLGFMVVTPSFTHLSIAFYNKWFSNCSPIVDVGFVKITSGSFYGNSLQDEYSVLLSPMLQYLCVCLFSKQCFSISFCQCWFSPLFLFVDGVFPWFVYADITLETVALDTPNNVSVYVTHAPSKRTLIICPLSKSDKYPIVRFFHTDCHSTQPLMHWHEH
jgi:hypothetical protein